MPRYTSMKSESLPFATNYNGDATLSPDKELNAIVKTANSVLTLDKGPYNGYSLPITSYVQPVFVKFQNLFNETVLIALSKNQTVNFIYRDDQINPVSNSPVSCWYIESGVLFQTSSTYLDVAPYIDPENPEQGRFKPNDWRIFYGLGSYTFSYSGSSQSLTSVYDLPEETGLSVAEANSYFITKQNWYATRGVATAQRWAHGSENPNTVPIWTARLHDDVAPYEWDAWHPTSTNDGQGTLENKNFDFKDNIVKNTPVTLTDATITYNFTKETDILLGTNNMVLTLGTAPYTGFTAQISSNRGIGEWVYVLMPYGGSNHCIALTYTNRVVVEYCNGVGWLLKSGSSFTTTDAAVTNAPSGYTPNDWRTCKGTGNFSFAYNTTNGTSVYGLPNNTCEVSTVWCDGNIAVANTLCYDTDRKIYTKRFNQTWDLNWGVVAGSTDTETLENKTINFGNNTLQNVASLNTAQTLTNKTIDADLNIPKNFLTNKNITNCVTQIPQDINLTLSSGTLTLKAGSKVYVPNGANTFNVVNIDTDLTALSTVDGKKMLCVNSAGNGIGVGTLENCVSGAGSSTTWGFAYDTQTNQIKYYRDTLQSNIFSLPIAIVTVANGAISSIDQVFNGVGYIGSVIFALPGLKTQYCVGYWSGNGYPKSNVVTIGNVVTYDFYSAFNTTSWSGRKFRVRIWSTDHMDCLADTHYTDDEHVPSNFGGICYNRAENKMYWYNNGAVGGVNYSADIADFSVTIDASKATISNFNPHQVYLPGAINYEFIPKEVWVTYNFTSFAEVDEYAKLGKRIFTKYGAYSYELTTANASTATSYYFTALKAGFYQTITINNSNAWSVVSSNFIVKDSNNVTTGSIFNDHDNAFISTPYWARSTQDIDITRGSCSIGIDSSSTQTYYRIGNPPATYGYFPVTIVTSIQKDIKFKSYPDGKVEITKTLSPGVHHLYGWATDGWTYNEFSFTDSNNVSYTYLL